MFYLYILQSEKDNSFYVGYSSDPQKRLIKHNTAKSGYTSRKKPWKIVYTEQFTLKSHVLKRERFIKAQKSSAFITKLIENAG